MTEPKQTTKKISRRDAIKLLGAVVGTTVLANLPSKWSTPEIARGVLPAHAQTSGRTILCAANVGTSLPGESFTFGCTINPPDSGIPMNFSVVPSAGTVITSALNGTVNTVAGAASTLVTYTPGGSGFVDVTWSFQNPADGVGTCTQSRLWRGPQ